MGVKVKPDTRKPGRWWVRINYHGKRKSLTFSSKKAADAAADKIDAALKLGQVGLLDATSHTPAPLFAQFAKEWLERYPVVRSISQTTMENYRSFTRHQARPGGTPGAAGPVARAGRLHLRNPASLEPGLHQCRVAQGAPGRRGALPQPRAAEAHLRLDPAFAERPPALRPTAGRLEECGRFAAGLRPVDAAGAGRNPRATALGWRGGNARRYYPSSSGRNFQK